MKNLLLGILLTAFIGVMFVNIASWFYPGKCKCTPCKKVFGNCVSWPRELDLNYYLGW